MKQKQQPTDTERVDFLAQHNLSAWYEALDGRKPRWLVGDGDGLHEYRGSSIREAIDRAMSGIRVSPSEEKQP